MHDYINIINKVHLLVEHQKTKSPFELARILGIHCLIQPLGNLKGFYTVVKRERYIVLNETLSDFEAPIVMAHELAHDQLHRKIARISAMSDINILGTTSYTEREANFYACELLIDDNTVFELAHKYSFSQIASYLSIMPEFLAFKVFLMNKKGYDLNIPIGLDSDFLGK